MAHPSFGTDGMRGAANVDLTPDVGLALSRAAAEVLGGNRVVIGRDTRQSGIMLEAAMVAGYTASGLDVELLGVVPTPVVAFVAAEHDVAGVMISASHNPFADNGIKLFAAGGLKLPDDVEVRIQQRFNALINGGQPELAATGGEVGIAGQQFDAAGWLGMVTNSVAPGAFAGTRVVLDCAHGAAAVLGPEAFRSLGADVIVIGDQPDGININAGIGSTHPELLQAAVIANGAAIGLAFDGDADRLIAVDGAGEIVDGDHVLAILALDWKATGRLRHDSVVVTVMSNEGFRRAMRANGIAVIDTGVGDRYVLEALDAGGFSLGGEQSGHVICRALATTGDGVLSGVQLLDAVVRSGSSLAELSAAAMTSMPQVLENVRLAERDPQIADRLADLVTEAEATLGAEGRVLVRPSGTEPLVRIMVEHLDAATASEVCRGIVAATEQRVGQLRS